MNNVYGWLKWFGRLRSRRLKLAGLWLLHLTGRRYLGVFLDPVLACNLRCRMCYFSDDERRRELHGVLSAAELERMAQALFHRALKLQIGCGAEPTLYKDLPRVVRLGKRYGVPYISLTTNGNLLTYEKLQELAGEGLDEVTLSVHGLTRTTYEQLMQGGSFEAFRRLLQDLKRLREDFPAFKVRVNYTMNEDNVEELARFEEVFAEMPPDVLQLRPIQKIGNSAYANFSLRKIAACYDSVLLPLVEACRRHGTVCLIPTPENLTSLDEDLDAKADKTVEDLTYCYLAPNAHWKVDFDPETDTFESYCRRTHRSRYILSRILGRKEIGSQRKERTRKLNYTVK